MHASSPYCLLSYFLLCIFVFCSLELSRWICLQRACFPLMQRPPRQKNNGIKREIMQRMRMSTRTIHFKWFCYYNAGHVIPLEYIIFIISSSNSSITWAFKCLLFSHCQIYYKWIFSDGRFEFDTNERTAIKQYNRNFDLNEMKISSKSIIISFRFAVAIVAISYRNSSK